MTNILSSRVSNQVDTDVLAHIRNFLIICRLVMAALYKWSF